MACDSYSSSTELKKSIKGFSLVFTAAIEAFLGEVKDGGCAKEKLFSSIQNN